MWRRPAEWALAGLLLTLPAGAQVPATGATAPATVPTAKKVVTTTPAAAPAAAAPTPPPNTVERARQGVVVLERQGRPLAFGAVLDGDGRILTALSPLGHGNYISVRYHDGTVLPVKLVHSDRVWDLALLLPEALVARAPIKAGLRAAKQATLAGLQSFALTPPNTISTTPVSLQLAAPLQGGDGVPIEGAYELGSRPALVGAPVVNTVGEVVALVSRACPKTPNRVCVPAPYGMPVTALKGFLQRVPAEATWLGIEGATDSTQGVTGVRVVSIIPDGPAASAGLRPGKDASAADLIVAVDGTPVRSNTQLNEAVRARVLGDSIELLVFGLGRYRRVMVKPRPAPELTKPPIVAPKPGKPRTPNPYR
jgi:serine protease Do